MDQESPTRLISGALSLSLHLVAGFALLMAWNESRALRNHSSGNSGGVLVVELIPLDHESGAGTPEIMPDDGASEPIAAPHPPARPGSDRQAEPSRQAAKPASNANRPAVALQDQAREMAELPSTELLAYRQRLETHLARYRIYPQRAREAGREGVVMLHFVMTHDGMVLNAWVGESSGIADIDREAVAAVMRAQPLPAFPQGWPGQLNVSLPVTFRLG